MTPRVQRNEVLRTHWGNEQQGDGQAGMCDRMSAEVIRQTALGFSEQL